MARTSAARSLGIVHPASTSRIERAASELDEIRAKLKELEERKSELAARLVIMVKREGEEDEKGKVRYSTDLHKFVVVQGKNVHTSGDKVQQLLIQKGVKATIAELCVAKATTTTPYEYVRVDANKASGENEDAAS